MSLIKCSVQVIDEAGKPQGEIKAYWDDFSKLYFHRVEKDGVVYLAVYRDQRLKKGG